MKEQKPLHLPPWPPKPQSTCGLEECQHGAEDHEMVVSRRSPYIAFCFCRKGCSGFAFRGLDVERLAQIPCGHAVNSALIGMN